VLVDNAIWLRGAQSGLHPTNAMLGGQKRLFGECRNVGALVRSRPNEDAGEQRQALEYLVRALDEDR